LLVATAAQQSSPTHSWRRPPKVPSTALSNGVRMPLMLLGVGTSTWMNNTSTEQVVREALLAGFPGVDTASHYLNQVGVARGIAASGVARDDLWLTTKVEGCGNSHTIPVRQGHCYNDTLNVVGQNLAQLNVERVDLTLLHSPPCVVNASWADGCGGNPASDLIYPHHCQCSERVPCSMMQEQWKALEAAYSAGRSRAIGVSNFCASCLQCIHDSARVHPHVNMFRLHVGMSTDPAGLVHATSAAGALVQAYQPLAHGDHKLFTEPAVVAIARAHGRSTAQVLLKWVVQLGHPLVTSTTNLKYMADDLDLWSWELDAQEMSTLSSLKGHADDPVGQMCVL